MRTHPNEYQRKADLGNGTYLNPILAGDRPDPSVIKHGEDYYMVHSSFGSVPGLLVWHSKDLVNWEPVGPALNEYVGIVWAPDISFFDGRFHIYFPVLNAQGFTNMVVSAEKIEGPWTAPRDLKVGNFDPGFAMDEDGKKYLFFNGGNMVELSPDGLECKGPTRHIYDGWPIPEHWQIETFAQEGPKILHHGDYYYMVLAEGGTAGPATSHMVIMARSKTLKGPWENSPYNPVVRTESASEKWWSKGHATLIEGADGKQWYLVYHAYENGYYNLGRQTLLEPVEWTPEGWIKNMGYDVSRPIPFTAEGTKTPSESELSDDFSSERIGTAWTFFMPDSPIQERFRYENKCLILQAHGDSPRNCSPLQLVCGDHAYEIEVEIECDEGTTGGLLLFYSEKLFAGLGFSDKHMIEYRKGDITEFPKPEQISRHFYLRIRNEHHYVSIWHSPDAEIWTRHWMNMEVSGYNHNVADGFLSLRPSLVAIGDGEVRFRNFKYKAIP